MTPAPFPRRLVCSVCRGHLRADKGYMRNATTLELACRLSCAEAVTGRDGQWNYVPPSPPPATRDDV